MHSGNLEELSARLLAIEQSLAAARREADVLRAGVLRSQRLFAIAGGAGIVALCIGTWLDLGVVTHAESGTVTAPFTVVGRGNKKILEVKESDDGARNLLEFYNQNNEIVAEIKSTDGGKGVIGVIDRDSFRVFMETLENGDGALAVKNADGKLIADIMRGKNGGQGLGVYSPDGELKGEVMASGDGQAQISIRQNGQKVAWLYGGSTSTYLMVTDPVGQVVSLIGQDTHEEQAGGQTTNVQNRGLLVFDHEGAPVLMAYDDGNGHGRLRTQSKDGKDAAIFGVVDSGPVLTLRHGAQNAASLAVVDGVPALNMSGDGSAPIVDLTRAPSGGGMLRLGNAAGATVAEAGSTQDGRGLMQVYPSGAPIGLLGIPGTFIRGMHPK